MATTLTTHHSLTPVMAALGVVGVLAGAGIVGFALDHADSPASHDPARVIGPIRPGLGDFGHPRTGGRSSNQDLGRMVRHPGPLFHSRYDGHPNASHSITISGGRVQAGP